MGHDRMHSQVLRESANDTVRLIFIIFSEGQSTWESPEKWKKTSVTPIFKKDEQEYLRNYRPFIFTLIQGKMMEQITL